MEEIEVQHHGEPVCYITYYLKDDSLFVANYRIYDDYIQDDWITVDVIDEKTREKLKKLVLETLEA